MTKKKKRSVKWLGKQLNNQIVWLFFLQKTQFHVGKVWGVDKMGFLVVWHINCFVETAGNEGFMNGFYETECDLHWVS